MLNIKRIISACMLICVMQNSAYAQALSIDSIVKRIDANNELLKSFELRALGYKYKGEAATAWMAPMIGVGTYMTPYPGSELMNPADKGSLMFQFEQEIPNRSELNAAKKVIESQSALELVTRAEAFNNLRAQARQLYNQWFIAEKRRLLLERNKGVLETMKKLEELRFTYNQSSLGSIYNIDAKIEENKHRMRSQEGVIREARTYLNALMNERHDQLFDIDSTYQPVFLPSGRVDSMSLIEDRADIQRLERNIETMSLEIDAMNLRKKPRFKIRFDHMSPLASGGMPNSYSVMGMVSIPIAPWSSKMYKSEIRGMQYDIEAMNQERSAMLQNSTGLLAALRERILSKEEQIVAIEGKVIPALHKTFDAYYLNYQENKLQLPVLMEAWEALNMMELDVLNERLALYQMIVDYEKELYR